MNTRQSPLSITFSVWKALFLREATYRLTGSRGACIWIFLEPVVHIGYLAYLYSVIRMRTISGIDTCTWIMIGMPTYYMFRRVSGQTFNALNANQALFSYRQVKPLDTILVRAALEGLLMLTIIVMIFLFGGFFDFQILPDDPLLVFTALFGMWLLGLGYGLIFSALSKLIPEMERVHQLIQIPMYMLSGVVVSLNRVPTVVRKYLMLNPVAHGIQAARLGFAPYYETAPELSVPYLYSFALVLIFLGLALHIRFAQRLVTQ
jgi:capsular polysaccharide transport system permease protein